MSKNHLNRFKVKKMFSSLLLSYGALLTVPFIIVFVLLRFWDVSMERYYRETVNNCLTEGRLAFEKRLEVLQAGAFSLVYDSDLNWVSRLEGIRSGDSNVAALRKCNEKLDDFYADSTQYHEYCVILENEFVFRKTGMCVGRQFFYDNYRQHELMSYEEWAEKSFGASQWQLFAMQQVGSGGAAQEAMTYSYPIRSGYGQAGTVRGVVQFLLPRKDISEMFSLLEEIQGRVYIFDQDGTMLAEIGGADAEESEWGDLPESGNHVITWIGGADGERPEWEDLPEPGDYVTMRVNGMEELVLRQDSRDGRLVFAAVLPLEAAMGNLGRIKTEAFLVLAVAVLFEITLGIRFAMRYSVPIRNVVENMQRLFSAEETAAPLSDYEFLEKGVKDMQYILREKSAKERLNFLALLFGGNFHTEQEVRDEAKHVGIDLSAAGHCVVVLYRQQGTEEVVRFLEKEHFPSALACYMVDEQRTALLMSVDEGEAEAQRECRQLLEKLWDGGIGPVYAGAGRSYADGIDLSLSFRQACYCADKAQREGKEDEALEYGRTLNDLNMPWYPTETAERLLNSAKHGKTEGVREIFCLLRRENIEKVHLSAAVGRMLASNITATLMTLCNSMAENEHAMETVGRIEKEEDLERALGLLEEQFLALSEKIDTNRDKKAEEYYERLKAYMEGKYADEQFGMSVAAEEFGLSESYFSLFFKEIMGKPFSSYLESLRLEKARGLISEGRYDLEQISGMVGYNSSATFRRAFKRAYGIAPSMWKGN